MASTGKKWAIGCGGGCLLMVIILGGIAAGGYVGIKNITERADDLEVHLDELDDRFGSLDTWTPPVDGTVDQATIQIFLAAREDLRVQSIDLALVLETLEGDANALDKIRAGLKLVPSLLEFVGQRAAVLLKHDLHPGEYTYLYALAYYSWLGHDPGDGPGFSMDGDDENESGFRWQVQDGDHDVHVDRGRRARRALNDLMITWLRSQRDALDTAGADAAWAEALDGELARLQGDPERIAWEDGLPEQLEMSLAPYRDAIEDGYSELLNGLEVAVVTDD